jgi:hypothetical protein
MRIVSRLVARSTVAILSTAMLCALGGTAFSQAGSSLTTLPSVTVAAPKRLARQHRPVAESRSRQAARSVASRRTSRSARTTAPAQGPVMARLAALEKTSSSCTDGCQTSFKYGIQPWNGCSTTAGEFNFSTTCRNVRNYKTYEECRETGLFLAARPYEVWWYCSSLYAGGKLSGEKPQNVAELKRSERR